MPRGGGGTFQNVPGTTVSPNTTIQSVWANAFSADVAATFNTAWPISLGGNGVADNKPLTNSFGLRDNSDLTKLVAFDASGITTGTTRTYTFPNASGTLALTSDVTGKATTVETRRQRIVNGDMRVSQENGTSSGTTNGYYPVDQWAQYRVTSAGTLTVAQVASVTPAGSPNRLRAAVTVADATLAAGEYWTLTQNLEGSNIADFQYGGAAAKASVLRFGFKGPAGTYAARVGNSAANRSFVALFTITAPQANTDTVQTISITGDTTGTWLTADGVIGITLEIVLACGSTFQGTTGWQSGLILGTSAVTNGMATGASVFELFDVGLKLDPDATGVYGQFEVVETDAVYSVRRYWRKEQAAYYGTADSGGTSSCHLQYEMAKAPTGGLISSVVAGGFPATAGTFVDATTYGVTYYKSATITAINQAFVDNVFLNARLS